MQLMFCAGGNRRTMDIAVAPGWATGARSDDTLSDVHRPLGLLDCHWTTYDWARRVAVARAERPWLADVPDVLALGGLPLALEQAAELAPLCRHLLLIPKADDVIEHLPRMVAGTPVVRGYSAPTRYGATPLPAWAFRGWPAHLLGGTPRAPLTLAHDLDVVSADGNMAQKIAN